MWLLLEVGERLKSALRSADTAARLGGDEFAILLPSHDGRAALAVARSVVARIGADHSHV